MYSIQKQFFRQWLEMSQKAVTFYNKYLEQVKLSYKSIYMYISRPATGFKTSWTLCGGFRGEKPRDSQGLNNC